MATLGSLSLWLALLTSVYTAFAFGLSAKSRSNGLRNSGRIGLIAIFCLLTVSVIILAWAIFTHNFQFEYVASETSINMSPLFLFSALWAGNAGSLLLWAWVLSLISVVVILRKWEKYSTLIPYGAMVLMITQFFFTFLLVFKLSPFNQLANVGRRQLLLPLQKSLEDAPMLSEIVNPCESIFYLRMSFLK